MRCRQWPGWRPVLLLLLCLASPAIRAQISDDDGSTAASARHDWAEAESRKRLMASHRADLSPASDGVASSRSVRHLLQENLDSNAVRAGKAGNRKKQPAKALVDALEQDSGKQPKVQQISSTSSSDAATDTVHTKDEAAKVASTARQQEESARLSEVIGDVEETAVATQGTKGRDQKMLKVCIMSADFWGLKSAGGTATAYHLLAAVLSKDKSIKVTFLGVSKKFTVCQEAKSVNSKAGISFDCLEPHHFVPEVVETYPYEQLSHAVLSWVNENTESCDVIHGHEWGGSFVDLITAQHFRQVKPGLRFAVEPHGGHFWSTQGQIQRPMDVTSLRIDNQERMANQLNDYQISPTNYMTAFLKQRGWTLPQSTITIPNVIPEVEPAAAAMMGKEKPVWRVAFFSRLEERKGIKLFVDAVSSLNVTNIPNFEVFFVGSEAKVDMRPSSVWLKEKTSKWPWKTHLKVGVKREEALDILASEGMLLVLCSLIDNMPYVVAEAAVMGIPFVAFDAGGVLELYNGKLHPDNVVLEPTLEALSVKLNKIMSAGKIRTVKLSDRVTTGRQQWLQWHADFADRLPDLKQEDGKLAADVSQQLEHDALHKVQVVHVKERTSALELWEPLCGPEALVRRKPLLLLTHEFTILDQATSLREMAELMLIMDQRGPSITALTFGSQLPAGKHSYPTSPSWMVYSGDEQECTQSTPILIHQDDFCSSFLAEARVFRTYWSWVLAMLMGQQNMQLQTYPKVMFKVDNFSSSGYSCMADKVPVDRQISYMVASNLYTDSEELLRNLHLAPYLKPVVSLIDDFPQQQRHKGWQFGYAVAKDNYDQMHPLQWRSAETGLPRDGKWTCGTTGHDYPSMHHSLLHPCAHEGGMCCGNSPYAPFLLRYESFFHSRAALLVLAYEVWPICGDGLEFTVRLTPAGPRKPQMLLHRTYEPDPDGPPNRQKIEWKMHIRTGDRLDFMVDPRKNHDCDGLYVVDVQLWVDEAPRL